MNLESIIKALESIGGYTNTDQLYGLCYLLTLENKSFDPIRNTCVDIIISHFSEQRSDGSFFLLEGKNKKNILISSYYSFVLNLLTYIGLNRFKNSSSYKSQEISKYLVGIEIFLKEESKKVLSTVEKTIGFEITVSRYVDMINSLANTAFAKTMHTKARQRLKNFSSILVFSPEGITGFINRIKFSFIQKKILMKVSRPTYVFNSPELTLFSIDKLESRFPGSTKSLFQFIVEHEGLPPFFKGEFYDFFWSVDILNSAGLLKQTSESLISKLDSLDIFNHDSLGTFNKFKGFAISPDFSLYDIDTTAMAMKAFSFLNINKDILNAYDFSYYQREDGLFYTFKNDNRLSPSALAHTLSAMCRMKKFDENIFKFLQNILIKKKFFDKFHTSHLYTLYCIATAYTDAFNEGYILRSDLESVLKIILSYKKSNGLFTSLSGIDGTLEETAWVALSLNYYLTFNSDKTLKVVLKELVNKIRSSFKNIEEEPRMWIVKQIYTPKVINTILFESIKQINV